MKARSNKQIFKLNEKELNKLVDSSWEKACEISKKVMIKLIDSYIDLAIENERIHAINYLHNLKKAIQKGDLK